MGLDDIDPFLETSEGRAFFPYYRFAPGYLLAPSDEAPLRRFLRRMRWTPIILISAIPLKLSWMHGHVLLVVLCVGTLISGLRLVAVWVRCRNLPRTGAPMPRVNATRRAAAALSNDFVEFAQLACLLFAVGAATMFWFGFVDRPLDLLVAIGMGAYWLWYCRIAWIKRREQATG